MEQQQGSVSSERIEADMDAQEMVLQRNHRGPDPACAQKRVARKDGWTEQRRVTFLQILGSTCNVSEAVRAVGMTISSVYDLRRRDEGFAEQWQVALEQAYSLLECMLVNRGLIGEERVETLRAGDATVKTTRTIKSYSGAVAIRLLTAHRGEVQRHRKQKGFEPDETVRERFQTELATARVQLQGEQPPDEGPPSRQVRRATEARQRRKKAGA